MTGSVPERLCALETDVGELKSWRDDADQMIEHNLCGDRPFQRGLIELGRKVDTLLAIAQREEERAKSLERIEKRRDVATKWLTFFAALSVVVGVLWAIFVFSVQQAGG